MYNIQDDYAYDPRIFGNKAALQPFLTLIDWAKATVELGEPVPDPDPTRNEPELFHRQLVVIVDLHGLELTRWAMKIMRTFETPPDAGDVMEDEQGKSVLMFIWKREEN